MNACVLWLYIFMLFINSESFQQVFFHIYIFFSLWIPSYLPNIKIQELECLILSLELLKLFNFFSLSPLCFILDCFYYCIFKFTDLYLLQCLMSDGWQNLVEKCSFQTCYLSSQKVAFSWFLCCLFLFHYVHNFLCLNLYTYNNYFKVLFWTSKTAALIFLPLPSPPA